MVDFAFSGAVVAMASFGLVELSWSLWLVFFILSFLYSGIVDVSDLVWQVDAN